jgi:hypothetical protein
MTSPREPAAFDNPSLVGRAETEGGGLLDLMVGLLARMGTEVACPRVLR